MTIDPRILVLASAALLWASNATATEGEFVVDQAPPLALPPPAADSAATSAERGARARETPASVERTFSFVPSPSLPRPWQVAGGYAASYASTDAATRPLAALASRGGFVNQLDAELGLHERFSLAAWALFAPPAQSETSGRGAGRVALKAALVEPGGGPFHLGAIAGYTRDFAGASGAFGELASSLDVGVARFGGLLHAEKIIASARDPVDLYAAAGVSFKTVDVLRLGAEYVGQDFEGAWERDEMEGGVRHFAGVTAALNPTERLFIVGGPALGLSERSPRVLGRAAVTYLF